MENICNWKIGEKVATREAYGKALAALGAAHDFVVLDADLAEATKTCYFKKAYPHRFFDCGIAEGNMIGVAAGLAAAGKTVFASSFAMFAAGRAFEQIRNSVAYPHQCLEDLSLMRTLPGMTVINPADAVEAAAALEAVLSVDGPCYLRFGRYATPVFHDPDTYRFRVGKGEVVADGTDVTLVATGIMVGMAMEAAATLAGEGISARVINISTIKPLDEELILTAARETGAIVTAEEHNIIGGLGSAVAETVSEGCPVPVLRVGVADSFGRSGKVPPLLELYGLTPAHICEKAKAALAMKRK